jgi:hypothetical protein
VHTFVRPAERHLHVKRVRVEGRCPQCGGGDIAAYRVFSEGGWWDVEKCQECLASLSRRPGPRFGSYEPLGRAVTGRE